MKRTLTTRISQNTGKELLFENWIHKLQKLGGTTFIVLCDKTKIVQTAVARDINRLRP